MNNMHPLFSLLLTFILVAAPVYAIQRTVGPQDDYRFRNVSKKCHGDDPNVFTFGKCSLLITCVYEDFPEAMKASLSSGTSIAALLPTMLALIGSPPLELVQLALVSPHRALATCCFTIGLPSGLFRQLRPLHTQLSNPNPREPRMREWTIPLPSISKIKWHNMTVKLCVDLLVMSLASIMLWRNWVVSSYTMVPWRCEYSFLLFAWPLGCMAWLIIAVALMLFMKESMEVFDGYGQKLEFSIWDLMCVPYSFAPLKPPPHHVTTLSTVSTPENRKPEVGPTAETLGPIDSPSQYYSRHILDRPTLPSQFTNRSDTIAAFGSNYIRTCITMPSNFGFRSWRWYEAIVESLAVGLYLYATFILTSTVFLNADRAMVYATIMTVCLSATRILSTLF